MPFSRASTSLSGSKVIGSWEHLFGIPGIEGNVYAVANVGTDIVAGGEFTVAGRYFTTNVALWNGREWIGMGEGTDGPVYAVEVTETDVYVAGQFNLAGGKPARNIARWDRASGTWHPVGDGIGGTYFGYVNALLEMDGNLYAAGKFIVAGTSIANNIARWDGSKWKRLGVGTNLEATALAAFRGDLLVGGGFATAGDVTSLGMARWNPTSEKWLPVEGGIDSVDTDADGFSDAWVLSLAVDGDHVYVGGLFNRANNIQVNNIVRWTPSTGVWERVGNGVTPSKQEPFGWIYHFVTEIAAHDGKVYVTGDFDYAENVDGGRIQNNLVVWNGSTWGAVSQYSTLARYLTPTRVPSGDEKNAAVIHSMLFTPSGDLIAGGTFNLIGNEAAPLAGYTAHFRRRLNGLGVARLRNGNWQALGSGVNGEVHAIHSTGDTLLVAGQFHTAGDDRALNFAAWNARNRTWNVPEPPVTFPPNLNYNQQALACGATSDDRFLYVATTLPGYIHAWDRHTGEVSQIPYPGTFQGQYPSEPLTCLAADNDHLIAGATNGVAIWSNGAWSEIFPTNDSVQALLPADGYLYAAGKFTQIGGVNASGIARLDLQDMTWEPLGEGLVGTVHALASDGVDLYAGGTGVGPGNRHLMVWDGEEWQSVPNAPGPIRALALMKGSLFVGGSFQLVDSVRSPGMAQWDGKTWHALGEGLQHKDPNLHVNALAVVQDTLYVGGLFNRVDGQPEYYLSRWVATGTLSAPEDRVAVGTDLQTWSHPNPFIDKTTIQYTLPQAQHTTITLHAIDGRRIALLLSEKLQGGTHQIMWQPGTELPAGSYICRITTDAGTQAVLLNLVR